MADKHAPEAVKSLHKVGFGVRSDPTTNPAVYDSTSGDTGRPDLMCVRGGRGVYIEVKGAAGNSFYLPHWNEKQRSWAARYSVQRPYSTEYWLWFYLGADPPNRNPNQYSPRRTWLVAYHDFLEVVTRVEQIQNTLPYDIGARHAKAMRELGGAIELLAPWELKWAGGGIWNFPEDHPFTEKYIKPEPLFDLEAV